MSSFILFAIFSVIFLEFPNKVYGNGDEHFLGKYSQNDEKLFFGTYGLKKEPCQQVQHYRCFNNKTHFTVNYHANKKFCISTIKLTSYPTINRDWSSRLRFYCQKGGIGTNKCFLVFEKSKEQIAVGIEIYGIPTKQCSFKNRYTGNDPQHIDAYGLPYIFDKEDGWNSERIGVHKIKRLSSEIFYYKNGLFNTQVTYLAEDDSFTEAREVSFKKINKKKKFSLSISNEGKNRISFLDVYWFQESMKSKPMLPYIYYNGECHASNKTCELIFDTDEQITYVLVKVFSNPGYDGSRLREKDVLRN
uniref:Uncharacterized protein n=1 Tax=Lutzomyia ayacuchensis TaxID=252632 RepID=L0MXG6_LUTAY|nr:hypothetical protein [Lutzomyia ayacuchensis]